jgi:hypothetical protein
MLKSSSFYGEVAERFKAPVLKTGEVQASVSSNLTLSAILIKRGQAYQFAPFDI